MINYDEVVKQIEKGTKEYFDETEKQTIKPIKPFIEPYKYGKITIKFFMKDFPRGEVISVIDILKQYYSNFAEFKANGGYSVVAELKNSKLEELVDEEKKKNQMRVTFRLYEPDLEKMANVTPNVITFEKEYPELAQEEINCILDVCTKYGLKTDSGVEKKRVARRDLVDDLEIAAVREDAKKNLDELGVIVYEGNEDFTWDCIAGYEQIKKEVKDIIINPLKYPEIYKDITAQTRIDSKSNLPRAVLFAGPAGTGKTTMARIIANESDIPLIYVPIESIMSHLYGVAEKRLSEIYDSSGKIGKSVLFLDEIDSLARVRGEETHEVTVKVLSVLLRKIQGFASIENIITLGATNRIQDLDSALLSRFSKTITFELPTQEEREAIFHYYAKHLTDENLKNLAKATEKASGRDIEDICGDAERHWASKIISEKSEISPPPIDFYLKAMESKLNKK